MANESDRKFLPDAIQTTFEVSMGAAYKGLGAMLNPMESVPQLFSDMKSLVEIPVDAVKSPQDVAQAIAGNFMAKGAEMVRSCKKAGERFTEEKK